MAELTTQQRQALALAQARHRQQLDREMSYRIDPQTGQPTHPRMQQAEAVDATRAFLGTGLPQGLSFGLADEARAALGIEPLEDIRRKSAIAEQAQPGAVSAGRMAGAALSSAIPVGGAMGVTARAPLVAQSLASGGAAMGQEAGRLFAEGEGGAAARMGNVARHPESLAVAGTVGAAAPVMGRIARSLTNTARGGGTTAATRAAGVDPRAARSVQRSFGQAMEADPTIPRRLQQMGPEATFMDVSPEMRGQASAAASMPGRQKGAITRFAEERVRETPTRISRTLDDVMGAPENMVTRYDDLAAQRAARARQAYGQLNREVPLDDGLRNMLRRADDVGALREAQTIAAADGFPFDIDTIMSGDTVAINGRALDYVSRGLRDTAESLQRAGKSGAARALRELNDSLMDTVPDLRQTRAMYRNDSRMMEITEEGRDLLNPNVSMDQFRANWDAMTPDEQQVMRIAARDALENRFAGASREGNTARNALRPRAVQEKLNIMFGDDAAETISRRIEAEDVFMDTRGEVARQSATAGRLAGQKEFQGMVDETGNRMGPIQRTKRGAADATNAVIDALVGRDSTQAMVDVGRIMTATGRPRDEVMMALMRDYINRGAAGRAAQRVGGITRQLTGAASGAAGSGAR